MAAITTEDNLHSCSEQEEGRKGEYGNWLHAGKHRSAAEQWRWRRRSQKQEGQEEVRSAVDSSSAKDDGGPIWTFFVLVL